MEVRDWPELLSDAPAMGGVGGGAGLPRLKRGQGSRHLGVDMAFNADIEDGANQRHKHFTSSGNRRKTQRLCQRDNVFSFAEDQSDAFSLDEDLIKHILTDGHRFFAQADESEMADL